MLWNVNSFCFSLTKLSGNFFVGGGEEGKQKGSHSLFSFYSALFAKPTGYFNLNHGSIFLQHPRLKQAQSKLLGQVIGMHRL